MGRYKVPIVIFLLAVVKSLAANVLIHTSDSTKYEPMVAFMCNKPAMVRTPDGWVHDPKQNCTDKVEEILNFCKKKYPNHDISNVVPSHKSVTINNWCRFGTDHCHRHNSHTVTPYRCLVGPFQSSALLVPEHCAFDHYHDTKVCASEHSWNLTSANRCRARNLVRQSYDILLPCPKTDQFMGVEYVCCPKPTKPALSINVHIERPHTRPRIARPKTGHSPHSGDIESDRPYFRYLHGKVDKRKSEHENYEIARRDWQRFHHAKVTQMMKDWSAARDRVVQLKATDPKTAEKLNTEIAHKFQKMYHALEADGMAEKHQLNTIHQNHVQRAFNNNKRATMQRFMDELQRDHPQASKLLQTLERYIRIEEKDRRHSVNHYEHMRDVDEKEAARIRPETIDHLRWIDKRIVQSMKMLHRFPEIEAKLKPELERFLRRFRGIESSARVIMQSTSAPAEDVQKKVVEENRAKVTTKKDHASGTDAPHVTDAPKVAKTTKGGAKKESKTAAAKTPIIEEVSITDKKEKAEYDPETMENEHKYYDVETPEFIAHQTDSRMRQDGPSIHKTVVESGGVYGATIGIAIGSVTVFVIIIIAMVMVKRKTRRKPMISHGFVEVDQAISPEERHVANMQINGYENPTYKYFEK